MPSTLKARRLAAIFLAATLGLSGIVFMPQLQHVFWAPEAFAARVLAPMAALMVLAGGGWGRAQTSERAGAGLLWLLLGCWLISTALAFRTGIAARELAMWLAGPLVFSVAWSLGGEARFRRRMLFVILGAGLLQALYAVLQSTGLDRFHWAVSFGGRAGAFLGNPNFLGGHLAMLLPLAVALALNDRGSPWLRAARWALVALLAIGLALSQTRGAWIGASLGLALLMAACRRQMPGLITRNKTALASAAAAASLALALFLASHAGSLSRLGGTFQGDEELSRRMTLMRCSLKLIAQRPLWGLGPGNFRIGFASVQAAGLTPQELSAQPYITSEHAHNDLLQMAADAGLPAALLFLALMLWTWRRLWKGLSAGPSREVTRPQKAGPDPLLGAGVLAALVSLAVHGLANFPFLIAPTQMTAWALAALGLKSLQAQEIPANDEMPARRGQALALAALAFFLLSAYDAGRMLMKDALWWVAAGELQLKNLPRAELGLVKTLQLDPLDDRLWLLLGTARQESGQNQKAVQAFQEAVRLNPHAHEARLSLGRLAAASGNYALAEDVLSPVAREAPNLAELWEPLAAALFLQGKAEQALAAYDSALIFKAGTPSMLENRAACLGSLGRYDEALKALDAAEATQPGRAKNSINRAITHYKMGQAALARQDLREAARRDPKDPQIQQLKKAMP